MPKKKFTVNNKQAMLEAINEFKTIHEWYHEYFTQHDPDIDNNLKNCGFDGRDFSFVVAYMHGITTKEEFFKNIKEESQNIQKDFKGTIDRFLDRYEKTDFTKLSSNTKEECYESLMVAKLAQIPGNINNFNPKYKAERFSTVEKQKEYDAYTPFLSFYAFDVNDTIWESTGINCNDLQERPFNPEDYSILDTWQKDVQCNPNTISDYESGKTEYYNITLPTYYYYYNDVNSNKDTKETQDLKEKFSAVIKDSRCITEPIESILLNSDSFSVRNVNMVDRHIDKSFFIDGVSLDECVPMKEGEDPAEYSCRKQSFFADAIKEGKAIDIAQTYIKDGKADTRIVPCKFEWSEEVIKANQEAKVVREHSWFRRTFFDWGPFRIKRDPNVMEEIYGPKEKENALKAKERNQKIMDYRNGKFLDELNQQRSAKKLPSLEPGEKIKSPIEEKGALNINNNQKDRINIVVEELENDLDKSFIIENPDREKTVLEERIDDVVNQMIEDQTQEL